MRAYAAHDAAVAAGDGHEGGWRALIGELVAAAWGAAPPSAAVAEVVDALWLRQQRANLWRDVAPEALALVRGLAARGVPVAVVSNAEGRAAETVAAAGLAPYLPVIVDSALVGIAKPDPRIFALAAEALALPLAALVHVGDSEAADVAGARAAGAFAVRFDGIVPNARPSAAHAVTATYPELAAVLGHALGAALEP